MASTEELARPPIPRGICYTHHKNNLSVFVWLPGEDRQYLYKYKIIVNIDNPQPSPIASNRTV